MNNVWLDGIFGLRITNVPGDPIQYLTAGGGLGMLGQSHVYHYDFAAQSVASRHRRVHQLGPRGPFATGFNTELC